MLNQVVVVGRLVEIEKLKDGKKTRIILTVPRSFKNINGEYENDYITVYSAIQNVTEHINKGDLLGIKGRLESPAKNSKLAIQAEKITFLSSKDTQQES